VALRARRSDQERRRRGAARRDSRNARLRRIDSGCPNASEQDLNFLLVHGAGEDPSVWDGWEGLAVDLQAGLELDEASMLNYEAVVTCDAALLPRPLCVVGRGMGTLVAQLAARRVEPDRLVLLDPWPPVTEPAGLRPESELALEECRRGVELAPATVPTLVLEGKIDQAEVVRWTG